MKLRKSSILSSLVAGGFTMLAFSGCQTPTPPTSQSITQAALVDSAGIPSNWQGGDQPSVPVATDWLRTFDDPALEIYIATVLDQNRSLEALAQQVEAAAAVARQAGGAVFPNLAATGEGLTTGSFESGGESGSIGSMSAALSWEVDLWGRLGALRGAAKAAHAAAELDYAHARLALAGFATQAWLTAAELHQLRDYAVEVIAVQERTQRLVQDKVELGTQTEKEEMLALANVSSARSNLARTERALHTSLRLLDVLAGRYPDGQIGVSTHHSDLSAPVPAGLPSALLERRADLVGARARVEAAFFLKHEASAARLPSLLLTAQAGHSSGELLELLNTEDGFWTAGGSLTAPLFSFGQLKEQVNIRTAEQAAALAAYGEAVLQAFSEVENALSDGAFLREELGHLEALHAQLARARELSEVQYEAGDLDLLSVLQLQQQVIAAQTNLISGRYELLRNRVDLHVSLGGNFTL